MAQKIRVCVWDSDADMRLRLSKMLNNLNEYQAVEYRSGSGGVEDLLELRPQLLLVDVDYTLADPERFMRQLRQNAPLLKVIALSKGWDDGSKQRLMESGFNGFLLKPFDVESFLRAAQAVVEPGSVSSEVLSFFSPKGKSGRTTMLINLAMALAECSGERVVIVDAETNFADVDAFLNLNPRSTIVEALRDLPYLNAGTIDRYLEEVNDKVMVLCGARTPQQAAFIEPKGLTGLIGLLRQNFRYILLDVSAGFNEDNVAAMEVSDRVYVTAMAGEPYAVKHMQRALEILHSLDNWQERVSCVITRLEPEVRRRAELEQALGCPVILLPNEYRLCAEAANNGRMALDIGRDTLLSQEIHAWARSICRKGR